MTHKIEFDPTDNLVIACAQGPLNVSDLTKLVIDFVILAKQVNCSYILTILNEAELKISMFEFYAFPQLVTDIFKTHGLQTYNFKRAFVGTVEQKSLKFYETVSQNRGNYTHLFYDIEEAKQWLRKDQVEHKRREVKSLGEKIPRI